MHFNSFSIRGIIVPLLTPFDSAGMLDRNALEVYLEWLIEQGIQGIMPCGTTGEGPLLSCAERILLTELVIKFVAGRIPVMAHVGTITTKETLTLALAARESGADAVSVVTPYYYRLDDDALLQHYLAVARAIPDMPVYLYTIPQCTTNKISKQIIEEICSRTENVLGIKDSSGDFEQLRAYLELKKEGFQVICGSDSFLFRALSIGAVGGVSGNANVFPEIVVGLFNAFQRGDLQVARTLQKRLDAAGNLLQGDNSLSLMKEILSQRGFPVGSVRPPLIGADQELIQTVIQELTEINEINEVHDE